MDFATRGRKRRLGVEDEYWQLILAGSGRSTRTARAGRCATKPSTRRSTTVAGAL
jgi:hypothetical protein